MYDPIGGRPRLNWDPVSDGGASRAASGSGDGGGFHFDLGGALARLGGPGDPPSPQPPAPASPPSSLPDSYGEASVAPSAPAEPLPSRARVEPHDERPVEPLLDPLPRRGERAPEPLAPVETPVQPAQPSAYASPRRSVFDDVEPSSAPSMPSMPSSPVPAPVLSRQSSVQYTQPTPPEPSMAGAFTAATGTATLVGPAPVLAGGAEPFLPTLPPPKPVTASVPTAVIEPAATTTDVNAFRAAQRRAGRQQRKGKLFGRTLLVLLVIGGLTAAALVFGRPYLYPTEWDSALTPIVDEIQTERGREFEHTVGLVAQPAAEYAQTVGRLAFDDAWLDSVPMWRALGMVSGEPTLDTVGAALTPHRLAVYDPDADRIYMAAGSDPAAADGDLRIALEHAFAAQHGSGADPDDEVVTGFTGVSPRQRLVTEAVHDYVAGESVIVDAESAGADAESPAPTPAAPALPLPLEYEVVAIEHLGQGLLSSAGVDPATATFQTAIPEELGGVLDDNARSTGAGTLQPGDRALAPPIALGTDDWGLVWGARLPASSVDRLVDVVVADSYRTIDRAGVTCVAGVFETSSAAEAAFVLERMQAWVAGAPAQSQAIASPASETRVQIVTCDPGAEAAVAPLRGAADALVNRQLERLSG